MRYYLILCNSTQKVEVSMRRFMRAMRNWKHARIEKNTHAWALTEEVIDTIHGLHACDVREALDMKRKRKRHDCVRRKVTKASDEARTLSPYTGRQAHMTKNEVSPQKFDGAHAMREYKRRMKAEESKK